MAFNLLKNGVYWDYNRLLTIYKFPGTSNEPTNFCGKWTVENPTSVGNSTKKSVPTQGVQTAGLRIDEVPNVTSLNRLMTPPGFHSHRIHVSYAYDIYIYDI